MSASFYDLLKYAKTGIASSDMTAYDKMRALSLAGGNVKTLTSVPPLTFKANGKPLISWSMLGNGKQTGTPSPDNIIMPEFCGKLVGTDWIIPIINAGQTVPIYLGQVQTVRKIKKLVLDGTENWIAASGNAHYALSISPNLIDRNDLLSTHFFVGNYSGALEIGQLRGAGTPSGSIVFNYDNGAIGVEGFKSWLSGQYAAGTPVVIWYVLANEETAIVNEPLCKIGVYADELHSEDAGVTIPTAKGKNVLTVDTELQPSEMTITYKG